MGSPLQNGAPEVWHRKIDLALLCSKTDEENVAKDDEDSVDMAPPDCAMFLIKEEPSTTRVAPFTWMQPPLVMAVLPTKLEPVIATRAPLLQAIAPANCAVLLMKSDE